MRGYDARMLLLLACAADADHDGSPVGEDCDDTDASVHREAHEVCNGRDDDCSGVVDDAYASGTVLLYVDADGDGQGAPRADTRRGCPPQPGYATATGDCNDASPTVFRGAPELENRADDDCDGRVDEDAFDEGRVFIDEIARQPRFGALSLVPVGQWFELRSTADVDLDLEGVWVVRQNAVAGRDAFRVQGSLPLPAKGFVVFCKDPAGIPPGEGLPLGCDYTWGDAAKADTWAAPGRDNTFNLQADVDSLSLWVDGDDHDGRLIDRVEWEFAAGWPREAARSLVLDPSAKDATDNDRLSSWCAASADGPAWWTSGKHRERGTPGVANPGCG